MNDVNGIPITREDQIFELFIQDIIIPNETAECLVKIAHFTDDLLVYLYNEKPYYQFNSKTNLIGQLIVGLAPHTSVGIIGRIIGFTHSQVCFAHPYWHSSKRRDCDGDGDAILLLLDVLLNFSKEFLPAQIGGLMDAPLILQPIVIPTEVQRQAHNFDVMKKYPIEFYESTIKELMSTEIAAKMDLIRDRLTNEEQFYNFHFTHPTTDISLGPPRSSYSTLGTLNEKIDNQIDIAKKISAVNPDEVVASVLRTHLIPDMIGNTRAYLTQSFRCKSCGLRNRRVPLLGSCLYCKEGKLQQTVTRKSALKYLKLATKLANEYNVGDYLKNRVKLLTEDLNNLKN